MKSDTSATVLSLIVVIAGVVMIIFFAFRTCLWIADLFSI